MKNYSETVMLSPNHGGKITPKFIVLHHSGGASIAGDISWIMNHASDVSYHYLIEPDGSRIQFVWDSKKAWHAGTSSWGGYTGLNSHSVGISFFGDTYDREVSDDEIDSCAEKCIYLMRKFDLTKDCIVSHQQIAPDRKNDPAPNVMERVLNRIDERLVA